MLFEMTVTYRYIQVLSPVDFSVVISGDELLFSLKHFVGYSFYYVV